MDQVQKYFEKYIAKLNMKWKKYTIMEKINLHNHLHFGTGNFPSCSHHQVTGYNKHYVGLKDCAALKTFFKSKKLGYSPTGKYLVSP